MKKGGRRSQLLLAGLLIAAAASASISLAAAADDAQLNKIVVYVVTPADPENAGCDDTCSKDTVQVAFDFENYYTRKDYLSGAASFQGGFATRTGGNVFRAEFHLGGAVSPHSLGALLSVNVTNLSDNAWYIHYVYVITPEKELYIGDFSGFIETQAGSPYEATASVPMTTSHGLMYYTLDVQTDTKLDHAPCEGTCHLSDLKHSLKGTLGDTGERTLLPTLTEDAAAFVKSPRLGTWSGGVDAKGAKYSTTQWMKSDSLGEYVTQVTITNPTTNGWLVGAVGLSHMGFGYFTTNVEGKTIENDPDDNKVNPTLTLPLGKDKIVGGYMLTIVTSDAYANAGCDAPQCSPKDITIQIEGQSGTTGVFNLAECKHDGGIGKGQTIKGVVPSIAFHRTDMSFDIGKPLKVTITNPTDNGWFVSSVIVHDVAENTFWSGKVDHWIGHDFDASRDVMLASTTGMPSVAPTQSPTIACADSWATTHPDDVGKDTAYSCAHRKSAQQCDQVWSFCEKTCGACSQAPFYKVKIETNDQENAGCEPPRCSAANISIGFVIGDEEVASYRLTDGSSLQGDLSKGGEFRGSFPMTEQKDPGELTTLLIENPTNDGWLIGTVVVEAFDATYSGRFDEWIKTGDAVYSPKAVIKLHLGSTNAPTTTPATASPTSSPTPQGATPSPTNLPTTKPPTNPLTTKSPTNPPTFPPGTRPPTAPDSTPSPTSAPSKKKKSAGKKFLIVVLISLGVVFAYRGYKKYSTMRAGGNIGNYNSLEMRGEADSFLAQL